MHARQGQRTIADPDTIVHAYERERLHRNIMNHSMVDDVFIAIILYYY